MDGIAPERLATQKNRLAQAKIIDSSGGRTAESPLQIARVSPGYEAQGAPDERVDRVGKR